MTITNLLLSPAGRIGRQSYWTILVLMVGASLLLGLVPFFGPLLTLALLWPMTCVITKRLHDSGRAAWPVPIVAILCAATYLMAFAATLMPVGGTNAMAALGMAALAAGTGGIALFATALLIVLAGIGHGMACPNRFGPPEATTLSLTALFRASSL